MGNSVSLSLNTARESRIIIRWISGSKAISIYLGGIATFLTILPLVFVSSIYSLSLVVLISGIFFAPMIIVTMSLIEKSVPENQLTEGMTWLLAGLNVGTAIGATLTGQLVDYSGVQSGVWIAIGASALVMLIAFLGFQRINHKSNKNSKNYA
ncbi:MULTISPECIES: MFS transporter [Proteus]|uniref:MFS transporter n=1 Tax=Proteus TaxID=583 RepID=UPI0028899800|nr:MFS transporter [Proteus terrae]